MKNRVPCLLCSVLLTAICSLYSITVTQAAEVDFSCMEESVRGKALVTDRYKEYDVNIKNTCPGAAYWSMCIERLDPWTHKILETHTPGGLVDEGKKARVNLHMKKGPDRIQFRNRFQAFYVDIAYGIKAPAKAACMASACEAKKSSLREEWLANEKSWAKAHQSIEQRVGSECPDSGWETEGQKECETKIREANQGAMAQYARKDSMLKEQLADIDPANCQVHAGGLVDE